ncbi:uncharacterized protein AAES06_024305 [Glossophaga mutica]
MPAEHLVLSYIQSLAQPHDHPCRSGLRQSGARTGTKKSPEQGPRRVRNREDLGSREDRCYGGPTLSTHGGCPRGVSAMPMSLRNRSTHPRRAQRRFQQLALILSLLWMLKTQVKAEEYWAFLPNPPVLHPVTWEDNDFVPVYVNNTQVLGPPSTGHILPMSAKYNYTGLSTTPPICFSLKSGKCIFISRYTDWDGNFTNGLHWGVDMLYLHRNVSTTTVSQGSPPPDIPVCKQRTPPQSQWGPAWRVCHLNHTICDQGICDWSDY